MGKKVGLLVAGMCLMGMLASTAAFASPMTPYENGYTWIADICRDDPVGRTPAQCISDKCAALYGFGTANYNSCVGGGVEGVLNKPPVSSSPGTPGTGN